VLRHFTARLEELSGEAAPATRGTPARL